MKFIKSPIFLLLLLFTFTRLFNLTLLPIFIDESTYIDWGWRTVHIPGSFFMPLAFYKMPLVMWLFGLSQYLISDPLIAGRIVSVFMGLLALLGIYRLSIFCFDRKTAVIAGLLYIFTPIFLFYDRQALMESALMATGIWSCYFLSHLIKTPKWSWSLLLGLSLGFGCLVKANGLIFIPPAFLIIIYFAWKDRELRFPLLNYYLVSVFMIFLVMLPIFFQPLFWNTIHNVSDFTFTFRELLSFPVLVWLGNLFAHLEIIFWYINPLILLAVVLGWKKIPVISAWTILTLVLTTITVRNGTPRYLVPYLPPLIIFAAGWLSRRLHLFPLFILPGLVISGLLITNPPGYFKSLSRFTKYSDIGYLTDRNTGYQAMATVSYLMQNLPQKQVYISVALNAGNPEQAVFNYLRRRPGTYLGYLDSRLFDPGLENISCLKASIPVFFVARRDEQAGLNRFFTLIATVKNPYNNDYNNIYTLSGPCTGQFTNLDNIISYYRRVL